MYCFVHYCLFVIILFDFVFSVPLFTVSDDPCVFSKQNSIISELCSLSKTLLWMNYRTAIRIAAPLLYV